MIVHRDIEPDAVQERDGIEGVAECLEIMFGNTYLGIDALTCNVDTAKNLQLFEGDVQLITERLGIVDLCVLVKGDGNSFECFCCQTAFELVCGYSVV